MAAFILGCWGWWSLVFTIFWAIKALVSLRSLVSVFYTLTGTSVEMNIGCALSIEEKLCVDRWLAIQFWGRNGRGCDSLIWWGNDTRFLKKQVRGRDMVSLSGYSWEQRWGRNPVNKKEFSIKLKDVFEVCSVCNAFHIHRYIFVEVQDVCPEADF